MPETWTTAQAALIVDKPLDAFQKALERAPVKPKLVRRGGRTVRAFAVRDLIFLTALDDLKRDLTAAKQAEIYQALMRIPHPGSVRNVEAGHLTYDFDPYLRIVESRIAATAKLLALIDTTGPEPLIAGTTIEAYRIAALLGGMTVAEILQDYPSLEAAQIVAAGTYADSNPKAGRPYPKLTAKKAMREARASTDEFLPTRE